MKTSYSLFMTTIVATVLVSWTSAFQATHQHVVLPSTSTRSFTTTVGRRPSTITTTSPLRASPVDGDVDYTLYSSLIHTIDNTFNNVVVRSNSNSLLVAADTNNEPFSSFLGEVDPVLVGGGAALALAVVLGSVFAGKAGSSGKESSSTKTKTSPKVTIKEPEPIDVSIPYDAPARLAYEQMTGGLGNGEDFDTFNVLYKEVAVAEVTMKAKRAKLERAFPTMTTMTNNNVGTAVVNGSTTETSKTQAAVV